MTKASQPEHLNGGRGSGGCESVDRVVAGLQLQSCPENLQTPLKLGGDASHHSHRASWWRDRTGSWAASCAEWLALPPWWL